MAPIRSTGRSRCQKHSSWITAAISAPNPKKRESSWSTTARDDSVTVTNGRTNWFIANFVLKGMLKIIVYPKGLTADLYLDGVLLAPQSTGVDAFVTPQVAHTVEAKNVVDPGANGRYKYGDLTQSAIVYTGGTRNVYASPPKV